MEHPSRNDFFINFKAVFNERDEFIDYIFLETSDNYKNLFGRRPEVLMGKSISEIMMQDEEAILGLKDIYYHMLPKTRRKFEMFFEGLNRWYLINIYSNTNDYLYLFFTDITKLKNEIINPAAFHPNDLNAALGFNNKLLQACFYDRLTGLYNRSYFEIELSRLDTERQLPISFIIGDLNGLKLINDAFGHKMGDLAIKEAANIMKDALRKEDIISRFGGDEFFVLLPNTSEETARKIVERMQSDCTDNIVEFIKLSVSFGVATKTTIDQDVYDIMKKAEDRMYYKKLTESKEAKLNMIKYLKDKLEELSIETKAHYDKLKRTSLKLAEALNLSDVEKEEIKLLCEFHDIGKIAISPDILQKKDKLTNSEWEQIKRHSEIGYHIVKSARESIAVDELILMHHERWDGNGYPGLIKEDEIPVTVRAFAIADAYEAMIEDRPYQSKMTKQQALKEIRNKSGTQFDPYIAEIFIKVMDDEKLAI